MSHTWLAELVKTRLDAATPGVLWMAREELGGIESVAQEAAGKRSSAKSSSRELDSQKEASDLSFMRGVSHNEP